jgi:hypothetical protein
MNSNAMCEALELPAIGIREPVPFVISSSPKEVASGAVEDLVKNIGVVLQKFFLTAIEKRTATEFRSFYGEIFPNYSKIMYALGVLSAALIPRGMLEQMTYDSLCEMESDFRDNAIGAFGSSVRDQAMFTVWTLRKINDLAQRLSKTLANPSEEGKDSHYSSSFMVHGLRMRFGLDCLLVSMHNRRPIYPEVLEVISDHLRSAVDAYAWLRQAVDLRHQAEEPTLPFISLDDEDREFIDASAHDFAAELE